jgi:phosphoribosylformylglycinamidine synthase
MAAPAIPGDGADLYAAVQAVGMELCPALGITIPVGKDSMSMNTAWKDGDTPKRITAPISLIISAFASVTDIRLTLTPQLQRPAREPVEAGSLSSSPAPLSAASSSTSHLNIDQQQDTVLLLIDLGRGKNRLGGSILAQVVSQTGEAPPDVDNPADLKNFWNVIQQLGRAKKILAYHDRSDGGLFATITEMAFAGHVGVDLEIPHLHEPYAALFNEELGAVIQIRESDFDDVYLALREHGLKACVTRIGTLNSHYALRIKQSGQELINESLNTLRAIWSDTTRRIAALRDNPACAESEYQLKLDQSDPGITPLITFDLAGPSLADAPSSTGSRLSTLSSQLRRLSRPPIPSPLRSPPRSPGLRPKMR